jgi:hypothetical protein
VKDQSLNSGNGNASFSATVTVPSSAADTTAPTVTGATELAKDKFRVDFSEAVKGGNVAGSATNPDNYKLNGKALPAGTVITLDSTKMQATVTMPAGSVDKTETKLLTVSGVQDLAGNTIATTNKTIALTDSVKPVLQSGAYDSATGALILTFSENVDGKGDGGATTPVDADFIVKVNGVVVTDATVGTTSNENQVKITSASTNFATGSITIATASTTTGADADGNTLVSDTLVVVR